MPSDDYTPIVRGGLKLKGASAPSGIKKKKKKSKPTVNEEGLSKAIDSDAGSSKKAAAQEEEGLDLRELEPKDFDGKTATERAYEETRRKRPFSKALKVYSASIILPSFSVYPNTPF
ncbi:hypothetical protein M7I_5527 [Glarea lozoyensis 74030]|uniref:Uncharacterized protein n=1 Tax=Glarea lozoyensis (strain ATCC 74030 / MF5533) TaxID=1104152 RepID=H0ES51_GLAL7|nr:hypothetical protein M7I_5527 [Glarea lozoyensis 74030]